MARAHLLQGAGALFVHVQDIQRLDPPAFERLSELRLPALVLVGELDLED